MLSISSASSSTTVRTWLMSRISLFNRSISRPGVPTTISTPRFNAVDLRAIRRAAVNGQDAHSSPAAKVGNGLGNLQSQLARRRKDQALDVAVIIA